MPIRVQPTGYAGSIIQLGKLAGEAEAERRRTERREHLKDMALEIQQRGIEREQQRQIRQEELALAAAERTKNIRYEKETAELRHKWDIEAFNRTSVWNIEKAEMASRVDFAREEKERQETLDEYTVKKKAIMNSNILDDREKQLWILQLETKLPLVASLMKPVSAKDAFIRQLVGGEGAEAPMGGTPTPTSYARVWGGGEEPTVQPATAQAREAKDVLPTAEQIAEYNRLGGRQTAEGRKYARDFIAKQPTGTTAAIPDRQSLLLEYKRLGGSKTPEGRSFADKYLR